MLFSPGVDLFIDVLLHNLFVIDGVSYVDICFERYGSHRRIKIDDIRRVLFCMKMRINSLHESRLARTCC